MMNKILELTLKDGIIPVNRVVLINCDIISSVNFIKNTDNTTMIKILTTDNIYYIKEHNNDDILDCVTNIEKDLLDESINLIKIYSSKNKFYYEAFAKTEPLQFSNATIIGYHGE